MREQDLLSDREICQLRVGNFYFLFCFSIGLQATPVRILREEMWLHQLRPTQFGWSWT